MLFTKVKDDLSDGQRLMILRLSAESDYPERGKDNRCLRTQ